MTSIEERVERLEAIEQIRKLKHRYTRLIDTGCNPDLIAPLFTEDATFDPGEAWGGANVGREAIHANFGRVAATIPWMHHFALADEIEITGPATAKAYWRLFNPVALDDGEGGRQSVVLAATYVDEYRKDDGEWKFADVKVDFTLAVTLQSGWGAAQFTL
jgi:hypothetical protein